MKMGIGKFLFGEQVVGIVDTDFSPCIDSVLSFPKFNQPGSVLIRKINRKVIEHHVEKRSRTVKQPHVSGFSLPGIVSGGNDVLRLVITVAEGLYESVKQFAFFYRGHGADLFNCPASAAGAKD